MPGRHSLPLLLAEVIRRADNDKPTQAAAAGDRTSLSEVPGETAPTLRECVAAGAVLLAFMVLSIAVLDADILFTKPFWLDEYHTLLLAERETLFASILSLARGSDYNPPLLHVTVRALGTLTGGVTEISLRAFVFACVWGSMVAVYVLLRRHVGRVAAFAGALAVWSHPLVLRSAFDGRFYAPWLLLTALFALAVAASHIPRQSWWRGLGMALSAVALCTVHYFGIITWGLVIFAELLWSRRDLLGTAHRLLPAVAGPIALAACLPLLVGQRAALTVPTWIPPLSQPQLIAFTRSVFGWVPLMIVVGAVAVMSLHAIQRKPIGNGLRMLMDFRGLLVIGLLPLTLVILSTVQPSLVDRYATPAALALAPIAALAVHRGGRAVGIALCSLLVLFGARYVHYLARSARVFADEVHTDTQFLVTATDSETPILAVTRATLYPLYHADPGLASRLRYHDLDEDVVRRHFPLDSESAVNGNFILVERDVARIHRDLYGFPRMIEPSELRAGRPILLVGAGGESFARRFFPGAEVRRLTSRVLEVVPGHTTRSPDDSAESNPR